MALTSASLTESSSGLTVATDTGGIKLTGQTQFRSTSTPQASVVYDDTHYADLSVSSDGIMRIQPSGGNLDIYSGATIRGTADVGGSVIATNSGGPQLYARYSSAIGGGTLCGTSDGSMLISTTSGEPDD